MNSKNQQLFDKQGFCILPFIHQEKKFNGTHHICCYGDQLQSDDQFDSGDASFNSSKMSQIRQDMVNDNKPSACNYCYQQEELGVYSPRQRENQTWLNWIDTHDAIDKCLDDYFGQQKMLPISYDLRYSNTCSLKCRMCNSSSSSAINAEYKKISHHWPEKFWTIDNPRINHDISLHQNIKKIYLAGGEPLLESYNLEFLNKLAEHNSDVVILINTSLNLLTDKFVEAFNKFKYLTLVISIDGVGPVNDYIRNGSNFEQVRKNIHKIIHHDLMFSTCVSMYNITHLKDLVLFLNQEYPKHSFNHGINLVNDVQELLVENLPYDLRTKVISDLNEILAIAKEFPKSGIESVLNLLQQKNFNQSRFDDFIRYTKILDQERNEDITKIVPEYSIYFNEQSQV